MRERMKQIFTAKKLEDAKRQAEQAFGVSESQIVFRILEQKKGMLGIGASVKIEAIYEPAEEVSAPAAEPTPVVEPVTEEVPKASKPVVEEVVTVTEPVPEEPATAAPVVEETVSVTTESIPEEVPAAEAAPVPSLDSLTEEQQAAVERVKNYVTAVYEKLGVAVTVTPVPQENGVLLELESPSRGGTIIGRRGETLDAMQYLSSIIANKGEEEYCRIILDSNGYREKRRQTLERLAERLSKNVIRNKRATTLEPMNPYERRIIHAKVAEMEGVSSKSVGEDPYRKVIILPLDENGEPLQTRRPRNKNRGDSRNDRKGGYRNGNGNRKKNGGQRRSAEEIPLKQTNFDDIMSTSFEKDYRKPKPEDDLQIGLYGKIE